MATSETEIPSEHRPTRRNVRVDVQPAQARTTQRRAKPPNITLRHIADIVAEQRKPRWLIRKILEACVIAILAGPRGSFKSFVALHWAMKAALAKYCVVILSAEGAGLDRRIDAWLRVHAPPGTDVKDLHVLALERQLDLASAAAFADLREALAHLPLPPDLLIIDTLSKYAGSVDENDNSEIASFLAQLAKLRDEFKSTVLVVCHAGHGDVRRPRGASALSANSDAEFIVQRPDAQGMTVTLSRERFKDSESLPPLAYEARTVDLGRTDDEGQPITSLVLVDVDAPAAAIKSQPLLRGKAQRQLLAALRAQDNAATAIWTSADLREIGRKAGLHKNTSRDAVEALTLSPHMTPCVGGWRLSDA